MKSCQAPYARERRRLLAPVIEAVNMEDPRQIPALFTPLRNPLSIQDTLSLLTLAQGQAQIFVLLATKADEVLRTMKGLASPEKA